MNVEHIAWQVKDPVAVAAWYGEHLGFTIVRKIDQSPHTHFLADASGRVVLEIYHNPKAPLPDYSKQDPLVLHLAFTVENVPAAVLHLVRAGGSIVNDTVKTPAGDELAMLRDPFGFPIQLCHRVTPLI